MTNIDAITSVMGSEVTCHLVKTYFNFIKDCYETANVPYIVLYFILIGRSEVKLRSF